MNCTFCVELHVKINSAATKLDDDSKNNTSKQAQLLFATAEYVNLSSRCSGAFYRIKRLSVVLNSIKLPSYLAKHA